MTNDKNICSIQKGVQYTGTSITTFKANNFHECYLACINNQECNYFTLDAEKICYLKNQIDGQIEDNDESFSGTKVCDDKNICSIQKGVQYTGTSITTFKANDFHECYFACINNQECNYFTLDAEKICYLKNQIDGQIEDNDDESFSGTKVCHGSN